MKPPYLTFEHIRTYANNLMRFGFINITSEEESNIFQNIVSYNLDMPFKNIHNASF